MILPLAISYWGTGLLVGAFLIVCVILMLVVLIQRPQGGGLSGAFGAGGSGGGAGQTAFGTKTGDALTFATIGMFVLYLLFAIGLNFATRPENIEHTGVPTVTSTDPVETSGSGPLPTDDASTTAPPTDTPTDGAAPAEDVAEDAAPTDAPAGDAATGDEPTTGAEGLEGAVEGAVDGVAGNAIDAAEGAANEIVDDAQSAADSATEPDSTETPPGL